jgi:hypothetical protein
MATIDPVSRPRWQGGRGPGSLRSAWSAPPWRRRRPAGARCDLRDPPVGREPIEGPPEAGQLDEYDPVPLRGTPELVMP